MSWSNDNQLLKVMLACYFMLVIIHTSETLVSRSADRKVKTAAQHPRKHSDQQKHNLQGDQTTDSDAQQWNNDFYGKDVSSQSLSTKSGPEVVKSKEKRTEREENIQNANSKDTVSRGNNYGYEEMNKGREEFPSNINNDLKSVVDAHQDYEIDVSMTDSVDKFEEVDVGEENENPSATYFNYLKQSNVSALLTTEKHSVENSTELDYTGNKYDELMQQNQSFIYENRFPENRTKDTFFTTKDHVNSITSQTSESSPCSSCTDEGGATNPTSILQNSKSVAPFDKSKVNPTVSTEADSETGDLVPDGLTLNSKEDDLDCPSCGQPGLTEDNIKDLRLAQFAKVLKQKLRLQKDELPKVGDVTEIKFPKLPQKVMEQTFKDEQRTVEEKYEFYARDEEVIVVGEDVGHECTKMSPNATGCYLFDVSARKVKRGIDTATFWFYKTRDRHDLSKHELVLYELGINRRYNGRLKEKSIITRQELYIKEGWVDMDMTIAVRKWVEQGGDKKILAIKCNTCGTKHYKALYGIKNGYKPVIVVKYLKPRRDRRERRDNCDPRTECCKRPLVASFEVINMHQIIRPKNMSIGFCYGYCDGVDQLATNHTTIRQRMRWTQVTESSLREQLKPCCVPLILKDTFILTYEGGTIVQKLVPNIIVERCGCL